MSNNTSSAAGDGFRPVVGGPRFGWVLRSVGVGLFATVLDLALLALLVDVHGWSPLQANVPALAVGLAVQFLGNKYFAFQDSETSLAGLARQGALFVLVEAAAFTLSAGAFHILASGGAHHLLARVVGSAAVYFGFSLPLWRLVFGSRRLGATAPVGGGR